MDPQSTKEDKPTLKEQVTAALETTAEEAAAQATADEVTVAAARKTKTLRQVASNRTSIRILVVTTDVSVLQNGSSTQQHYADLAQFVGEVHLMVVQIGRGDVAVERPMKNVWVYKVPGRHIGQQLWRSWQTARQHLRFNNVVQPDVIVSIDPFTAGLAGWILSRTLRRPWQVHVVQNYFTLEWLAQKKRNKRLLRLANFVLKRCRSARGATERIKTALNKRYRHLKDTDVLPHLFNLSAYRVTDSEDVHDRFPQYSFIMFAEGEWAAESALHDVFAATHQLLRNSRVALIVRGHGRAKQLFTQKVSLLGIEPQVVFMSETDDPVALYRSTDVFIEASTAADGNERILQAIAASTPVVAYTNEFREDIITNGESGFLCEAGNSFALGGHIRTLLNDSARRTQFARRAQQVADEQLHEDIPTYFMALRDTIATAITEEVASK